ncbi:unnamed protein product [Spirodela intermedia]|uniref:PHD-type domain-containing protein n=1 Tax=Spirodela intermedia TaxID=51605 RepID=A0A7I8KIG3_SPIIN|nr:unnamed protein product [Spirodela intermedia]
MVLWRRNSTAAAAAPPPPRPPRGTFLVLNLSTNTVGLGNSSYFQSFPQLEATPSAASQATVAGDYPTEHRRRLPRIPSHRGRKDENTGRREEGSLPPVANPCSSARQQPAALPHSSVVEETKNASSGTAPPPAYLVNLLEFFGWMVTSREGGEAIYTSPEGSAYYSMAKAFEKFVGDSSQKKETARSSSQAFHGGGAGVHRPDVAEIKLNEREGRKNGDDVDIISVIDVTEQAIPRGSRTDQLGGRRGTIEEDDGVSLNLSGETEHPPKKVNQVEIKDHSASEREINPERKRERNLVGSSVMPGGGLVKNDGGKFTFLVSGEMRYRDKVNHFTGVNEKSDDMGMEPSTKRYLCEKEQCVLPHRGRDTEAGVDPCFQDFSTLATYPLTSRNTDKPQDSTSPEAGMHDEVQHLFSKETPFSEEIDRGIPSTQIEMESRSLKKTERTKRRGSKRCLRPRNNLIDLVHARRRNPGDASGLSGKRRQRSGCGLTVRKNEDDAQVGMIPQGRITALSWLIDAGILFENGILVHKVNDNGGDQVRGLATRDGIWCSCCEKTMPLLEFDSHAGSDLGQPWYDICLASGKSLMQCQMEAWERERKLRKVDFQTIEVGLDPSDDSCGVCADGGYLICCDSCPSTFHQDCLQLKALPEGRWHCPYCTCTFCSVSDGKKETLSLFTCQQCYRKYHWECTRESQIPEKLAESLLFCGEDCKQVDAALFRSLGIVNKIGEGLSWVLLKRLEEQEEVNSDERVLLTMECNRRLSMALLVLNECFMPVVDFRTGVDMISHAVFNCGSNFKRLHYAGFYTMILEKDDEIISAASLRFHGRRLAEMPFMGTRPMHRRQGMCRRLLTAIEQLLSSLRVEKLMIPAAGELLETWIDSFSFEPLEESDREEIRSLSLVAFPQTFLLKKSIPTTPGAHAGNDRVFSFLVVSVFHGVISRWRRL